ncbi:Vacuolar protein sorting-associated protein 70 [Coemansia spiralis]|uniref:Vacuolar protein sorting-associated protein 70 n=2 Tax=Coemansia TaxID=4863 RepID=A0A9W8G8K4_9FUNG|nr:Vacuolar protein sorting-associated protein 70 [Coemansia umbellata]KAJ2678130.1 Vacuolar protein sorting-associated protein 70 [Coemansia spiralis]
MATGGAPRRKAIAVLLSAAAALVFIWAAVSLLPAPQYVLWSSFSSGSGSRGNGPANNGGIDPAQIFLHIPSTDHLRHNLQYYASGTHVAGINTSQALYTKEYFEKQGIDSKIVEYYPWMNYPIDQKVVLFNETTYEIFYKAGLKEDVIPGDDASEDPNNLPAFHGLSANGNVTGKLVYANYGALDDFEALADAGISVKDKIVLVRYGGFLRGLKVKAAAMYGARGVLIYSDPADDGYVKGKVYPDGPWRPESSFQRGSVALIQEYPGDPLTPGYPATKNAPHINPKDAKNINRIPSLPLSYRDAQPLLQALQGYGKNASDINPSWVGGLKSKGVEYWTGPSALDVNLLNKVEYKMTPIQNVIARIKGWEDPERAVIIGNHRDAWCAGASDPSSGSAILLELARAFGELKKLGWRPRRSIILASWDAEEYGLIGSTEWVEENIDWLRANAVGYVNVDAAVGGSTFAAHASPVFKDLLYKVTKQVPYPDSNKTLYDVWLRESLASSSAAPLLAKEHSKDSAVANSVHSPLPQDMQSSGYSSKTPVIPPLGAGSDFTAFMAHAGVSSLHLGFDGDEGAYHSNYDSFARMTAFIDPEMKLHRVVAQVWGLLAIRLADDAVVDFNVVSYARELKHYINELKKHISLQLKKSEKYTTPSSADSMEAIAVKNLRHLRAAQRQLLVNAHLLEHDKRRLRSIYGEDCQMSSRHRRAICLKLRESINDRVSQLERHFIDPEGIPGREWYKHVLVSPGRWMGYGFQLFPAIAEAAEDHDWKKLRQHEKHTAGLIHEAAWFLRDV